MASYFTIGSNCHGTSVAATEFCPTDLPRTEVLVAYCLPRKTQILTILPRKTAEILAKSVNLALLTERKLTICKQTSNFSTESLEKRAGFLKVQRSKHALIINLRAKIRLFSRKEKITFAIDWSPRTFTVAIQYNTN